MEGNSSKQILLSIIGIAVLVIAVIGVSFAFFSYTKEGSSNNVIETGQIYMNFEESNSISLTNQFPMTNNEALAGIPTGSGQNESASMTFTVEGYSSGSTAIPYHVYAIRGTDVSGKDRFPESEISVFLSQAQSNRSQPISKFGSSSEALNTVHVLNSAVANSSGWEIASGSIQAGTDSGSKQRDTYTLKMFVNDTVRISDTAETVTWEAADTDTSATKYCASARTMTEGATPTYVSGCKLDSTGHEMGATATGTTLKLFNNMYYSLKVKVVGNV